MTGPQSPADSAGLFTFPGWPVAVTTFVAGTAS